MRGQHITFIFRNIKALVFCEVLAVGDYIINFVCGAIMCGTIASQATEMISFELPVNAPSKACAVVNLKSEPVFSRRLAIMMLALDEVTTTKHGQSSDPLFSRRRMRFSISLDHGPNRRILAATDWGTPIRQVSGFSKLLKAGKIH